MNCVGLEECCRGWEWTIDELAPCLGTIFIIHVIFFDIAAYFPSITADCRVFSVFLFSYVFFVDFITLGLSLTRVHEHWLCYLCLFSLLVHTCPHYASALVIDHMSKKWMKQVLACHFLMMIPDWHQSTAHGDWHVLGWLNISQYSKWVYKGFWIHQRV